MEALVLLRLRPLRLTATDVVDLKDQALLGGFAVGSIIIIVRIIVTIIIVIIIIIDQGHSGLEV